MPDNLDFLLDQPSTPRTSYWVWATVTSTSPLQIRLDGDSAALLGSPVSLVNPLHLSVGGRVRVEMAPTTAGRQAIVHGPSNLETDTGWITSGILTATAGLTLGSYGLRRVGPWVAVDILATATTSSSWVTSGDFSNSQFVLQLTDSRFFASRTQALPSNGASGRVFSGAVNTSGSIYIGAIGGTVAIASGDSLRFGGTYLAD